jgi:general stress protein 26
MDSINKQQPEHNMDDLNGRNSIKKIKEIVKKNNSCFFLTETATGASNGTRPMSVQNVDENGHLWFLSASDSHKNEEIDSDPRVRLYFQSSSHSDFMYLAGSARITRNRDKIDELWEPLMKVWFTDGKDDARITVIEVIPEEGYYWDTKHGNFVAGVKMMIGAAVGKTLDDSIEGKIKV